MKLLNTIAVLCALLYTPLLAETASDKNPIRIGQTRQEVRQVLGEPTAQFKKGATQVYMFTRGTVQFKDGKVTDSDLLSVDESEKRETQRLSTENARREHLRAQQESARKHSKTLATDDTFKKKTADEQIIYWEDFAKKNPGVDVSSQLKAARKAADEATTSGDRGKEQTDLEAELRKLIERQDNWDARMAETKVNWERWELEDEKKADAARKNEITQRIAQLKQLQGNKSDSAAGQAPTGEPGSRPSGPSGPPSSSQGGPPGFITSP